MIRFLLGGAIAAAMLAAGCRAGANPRTAFVAQNGPLAVSRAAISPPLISPEKQSRQTPVEIQPVSHLQPPLAAAPEVVGKVAPLPVEGELSLAELVAAVESKNPSLQAMVAAWQAAAQRYPQVIALDDPMLMAMSAPGSIHASPVENAYVLQLGQKLPWFGKRAERGRMASNEADAAFHDVEDSRLQISLAAQAAYYEYFLAQRLFGLNDENLKLMRAFRETAQARYRTNQVTQQDLLQADVEIAELDRRRLELQRMNKIAIARINTLLREPPGRPLPLPAAQLPAPQVPGDADQLLQMAIRGRPDLSSIAHRIQADEASLALAYKQYYPDAEFFGRYDSFWQPASTQGPLRGQVGVNFNLPIYRQKLNAAVCEAQYRLQRRRAEYQQRLADIDYEVQSAWEQVEESRQTVALYEKSLVPIARQNVAAARANYEVGKLSFLELAQAQRQQVMVREKQQEAVVLFHRRLAELSRLVGQAPATSPIHAE